MRPTYEVSWPIRFLTCGVQKAGCERVIGGYRVPFSRWSDLWLAVFFWGVDSIFLESCTKELISLTTSQTPDSSGIIYCQRQKDCEALLRVDLQKRQRWHESMTDGNDWKGFAACCWRDLRNIHLVHRGDSGPMRLTEWYFRNCLQPRFFNWGTHCRIAAGALAAYSRHTRPNIGKHRWSHWNRTKRAEIRCRSALASPVFQAMDKESNSIRTEHMRIS